MVKSKKALYILIPLVAFVWGLIIYQIMNFTRAEPFANQDDNRFLLPVDSALHVQSNKLLLNYSDPFLRNLPVNSAEASTTHGISIFSTNPEPKKKKVTWPEIEYKGLVKTQKMKHAILKVNNKKTIIGSYQTVDGIMVKGIYRDSVIIEKDKEFKTIYK